MSSAESGQVVTSGGRSAGVSPSPSAGVRLDRATSSIRADGPMTINELLDERTRERGDHVFLRWQPFDEPARRWTYATFNAEVCAVATGLARRGVRGGDRVLIHLDNCPEYLVSWFAVQRIGAVAVCTNTRASPAEMAYFADHSRAVGAITGHSLFDDLRAAAPNMRWISLVGAVTVTGGVAVPFESLRCDGAPLSPVLGPLAPASIQYTSGTTSRPKGVVWTHANIMWGAEVNARHEELQADDVHLVHLPLFHTNAQSYSMLATLWAGASMVLVPRFSASRFWDVSITHRVTWTWMVGFCLRAIADQPVPDNHTYRLWGVGASSPSLEARTGIKTVCAYGMTETISHPIIGSASGPNAPQTMGRQAPEYKVEVRRAGGGRAAPGEPGELFVQGEPGITLFREYLEDPSATAFALDVDGWLRTGDLVSTSDDGDFTFLGRTKDMLKVGGENVAAAEIESVLLQVPGVAEAATVGRPDPMLDEVPVAFLVAKIGHTVDLAEAETICRRDLADYKIPREIHLLPDLPRAAIGKVAKHELRRRAETQQSSTQEDQK